MKNIVVALIGMTFFWSCENGNDASPLPAEFSIGGKITDYSAAYEQTVFDGGHDGNINVFNRSEKTLLIQSFKNSKDDTEGFWTIRINGLDIENLTLPYTLTGVEGSITWIDESVKNLQEQCSPVNILCFYSGVGVDEIQITITSIENETISGNFGGTLYHIRVNPSVIRDTDDAVEVLEGQFKIKFQTK